MSYISGIGVEHRSAKRCFILNVFMDSNYEKKRYRQGYACVIGCDEVGKGSLAGPVVAAAVVFAPASLKLKVKSYKEIKDSKLLTPGKREELSEVIKRDCAAWGIGLVAPEVIDEINIHQATLLAMRNAVDDLLCHCERVHPSEAISSKDKIASSSRLTPRNDKLFLYLDGKFTIPKFDMEQEAVVKGDNKILSVAAASIVAKVFRDDLMRKLHEQYPCYNFAQHKGYGTLHHRKMILQHGLSPIHRISFCQNLTV